MDIFSPIPGVSDIGSLIGAFGISDMGSLIGALGAQGPFGEPLKKLALWNWGTLKKGLFWGDGKPLKGDNIIGIRFACKPAILNAVRPVGAILERMAGIMGCLKLNGCWGCAKGNDGKAAPENGDSGELNHGKPPEESVWGIAAKNCLFVVLSFFFEGFFDGDRFFLEAIPVERRKILISLSIKFLVYAH